MPTVLHVAFSPSFAGALGAALRDAGRSDRMVYLPDNFSFGPIAADDSETRARWVEQHLGSAGWADIAGGAADFLKAFALPSTAVLAWTSRRDVTAYAGFLWWLANVGDIEVATIDQPPFACPDGVRLLDRIAHATPLPPSEQATLRSHWQHLRREDAPLRVIDGDTLVSAPMTYFDPLLLGYATPDWQRMARIIGQTFMGFVDTGVAQTSDLVLHARLIRLAETGRLDWRGELRDMAECEVRLPVTER